MSPAPLRSAGPVGSPPRAGAKDYLLRLADGTRLVLSPGDAQASETLDFFARTARLSSPPNSKTLPAGTRRLLAASRGGDDGGEGDERTTVLVLDPPEIKPIAEGPRLRFNRPPMTEERSAWVRLARISAAIGRETLDRGGVLIHGGLAAAPPFPADCDLESSGGSRGGAGILLAGRSGVGKSTASRRLPPPWRPLCDDVTLVVRDGAGRFWAHPFPTWSRFFGEEAGDGSDTWDIQEAVPLKAIFVLEQGPDDRAEKIGGGHTLALLSELANQATNRLSTGRSIEAIAAFHLARYHNLCALVRAVPAHLLHVSFTGAFWDEIARVLKPTV